MTAITLPPRCDRAAAEALLPALRAAADKGRMAIDGTAVEQVGQAMLQLLASARCSGSGASIAPSPALAEAARMTGLTVHLFDEAPQ